MSTEKYRDAKLARNNVADCVSNQATVFHFRKIDHATNSSQDIHLRYAPRDSFFSSEPGPLIVWFTAGSPS